MSLSSSPLPLPLDPLERAPRVDTVSDTSVHPLARERHVSFFGRLHDLLIAFSPAERLVLYVLSALLAGSTLTLTALANSSVSVTVPSPGGEIVEGVVGTPRFINPLLAISQVDQDLTTLVYSGLMRADTSGTLIPDIAERYEISEDGASYTFYIRPNAVFHDGTPVTAEDVIFTMTLAQNPDIKSPRRADWEGVTASSTDPLSVTFTLPHAYAPFLENAQLGILPKHIWQNVTPEEFPFFISNTHPVGSGPFSIQTIETDKTLAPTSYTLKRFDDFVLGAPYLERIVIQLFSNTENLHEALEKGDITSVYAPVEKNKIPEHFTGHHIPSTRIFGVFFNQNRAALFTDPGVRKALNIAVDREGLIRDVLKENGIAIEDPIPPGLLLPSSATTSATTSSPLAPLTPESRITEAQATLSRAGWTFDETEKQWTKNKQVLSFALATADTPELATTAEALAARWRAAGIKVDVQMYPLAEFNPTVLRPRAYDAILFGEVVGRTLDLFAFWHSSQRTDPGLNLALYANTKADRLLAGARTEIDAQERANLYHDFLKIIREDQPGVFLYTPEFLYMLPVTLDGVSFGTLTTPSERFLRAHEWYTDVEEIWSIFASTRTVR